MTDAPATPGPRTDHRSPTAACHARLDSPLREECAVGAGTALFVCGSCFHPRAEIRSLRLVLDGEPRPLMAERMPRLDVFRALHPTLDPLETSGLTGDPDSDDDPQLRGYRSGFWGIVEIEPTHADRAVALGLRATLEDGTSADAELGRIGLRSELSRTSPGEPAGSVSEKLVAICMATYNPPSELFERQIESIRRQTHRNWVCVISDDCSSPEGVAAMEAIIGDDPRFVFSPPRAPGLLRELRARPGDGPG